MNAKSSHAKGRRLVKWLIDLCRERVDKGAYEVSGSGAGLDKNDVRLPAFDIEIECKNAANFNLVGDWAQVKRQTTGENVGVLAVRHPQKPEFEEVLIVMSAGDWLDLLARTKEEIKVIGSPDKELKYDLLNLKEAIRRVSKHYEPH